MYKIFDIHTHTYPEAIAEKAVTSLGRFYDFVPEGQGTYAELEALGQRAEVCGFLLFSVATNGHQVPKVNDSIAALVELSRSHGFETVGFAGMHQDYPDMEGEVLRAKQLGAKGVKLHPDIQQVDIDDPRLCRLYGILARQDLPVCLHMGDHRAQYRYSSPDKLVKVAKAFPKTKFIASHLGAYRAWEESDQLIGLPNVWFDTSSVLWSLPTERTLELIRSFGVDRVFFGTDYPVTTATAELNRFFALPLLEEERRAILWDNAARFLNLS